MQHSNTAIMGNLYNKYHTRNPVARLLFDNFLRTMRKLTASVPATSILEVGCGEGYLTDLLSQWKEGAQIWGIDLSQNVFDPGARTKPRLHFSAQSAYELAFPAESFDLVVGAEVLEHLESPQQALKEIQRVVRTYVLLSVPREPIWRLLNVARLAYLRDLGNTPGHIQHWTTQGFVRLVSPYFGIVRVATPFPWTMILATKG